MGKQVNNIAYNFKEGGRKQVEDSKGMLERWGKLGYLNWCLENGMIALLW